MGRAQAHTHAAHTPTNTQSIALPSLDYQKHHPTGSCNITHLRGRTVYSCSSRQSITGAGTSGANSVECSVRQVEHVDIHCVHQKSRHQRCGRAIDTRNVESRWAVALGLVRCLRATTWVG
jgi:hypothetical protein